MKFISPLSIGIAAWGPRTSLHISGSEPDPLSTERADGAADAESAVGAHGATGSSWPQADQPRGNHLLAILSEPDRALLRPAVESVPLKVRQVLYSAGERIAHVHFVDSGLISIVGTNQGDRRIEVGMVGFEGLAGIDVVLGTDRASSEALVQSAGSAWRITSATLRELMAESRSLSDTLLRFAHVFMIQANQTAIAAGCGKIEERLARGLLMWHDRIRDDELFVTHEFLALLLGVRRQGVTVALHELEGKRLIKSTRNMVRILDRAGLQREANGFYGIAEEAYVRALGPASGRSEVDTTRSLPLRD